MKRLRLLLLDANVVIKLQEQRLWDKVAELCDVHLARTVLDEAHFYEDEHGVRQDFDLAPYEGDGRIKVFDVAASQLQALRGSFDPSYAERLDPGELESLALLLSSGETFVICSADSIVFKTLGNTGRGEQGISLEEVLSTIGMGRKLPSQFSKKFRERWTAEGSKDQMYGIGKKPEPS